MIMSRWAFLSPTQSIVGRVLTVSLLIGGLLLASAFAVNVFVSTPTQASNCCGGSKISPASDGVPSTLKGHYEDSATFNCCSSPEAGTEGQNLDNSTSNQGAVPLTSVTCSRTTGQSKKCKLSNGSKCSHNCKKKKRCSYSGC